MPAIVDPARCNGCQDLGEARCMYICPNDLMVLTARGVAVNQEPEACRGCCSCIKACPTAAIALVGMRLAVGATVPAVGHGLRNHVAPPCLPAIPDPGDIESELLCTEFGLTAPRGSIRRKVTVAEECRIEIVVEPRIRPDGPNEP